MRIEHSYTDLTGGQWLRGNLHTHTNKSDGRRGVQDVLDDYAARGYDFLMLSDHDLFTWSPEYNYRNMIAVPGNEISANGPHLLHVNCDRVIAPSPRRQEVLNEIAATKGFAVVNHPNWQKEFNHCTIQQMTEWVNYIGMEIYNGTIGRLDGSPYATNKWDILLSAGRKIWGFANDDSHLPTDDVGLGWNMVYTRERTLAGLLQSMQTGRFYASTGVTINNIEVNGNRIKIETSNAERIVALKQIGRRFAQADASSIEVTVPDDAKYVRFECWGKGESFAWTNPFFILPD